MPYHTIIRVRIQFNIFHPSSEILWALLERTKKGPTLHPGVPGALLLIHIGTVGRLPPPCAGCSAQSNLVRYLFSFIVRRCCTIPTAILFKLYGCMSSQRSAGWRKNEANIVSDESRFDGKDTLQAGLPKQASFVAATARRYRLCLQRRPSTSGILDTDFAGICMRSLDG